jgi:ribosomal protein S18 acetylase RimI-like enzyme
MPEIEIAPLTWSPATRAALIEMLIETVAHGGSVSFMHPLAPEQADAFWKDSLAAADRGERIVLGAFDAGDLIGTVTLLLALPPNQPHRAEIAKMMTRISHRRRGVARALMRTAESMAVARGRTLLVLDTAVEDGAAGLYEGLGFSLAGIIPDYALKPHGGLTGTMIYWKRIGRACTRLTTASQGHPCAIARKSDAFRLAPPTSAPLTLATAINSAAFEGLTEPP